MTQRTLAAITLAGCLLGSPMPAAAQSRVEQQLLLEMRALQEQVQRLQASLNVLADQVRQSTAKVEAQGQDTLKSFANQGLAIAEIAAGLRALNERENDSSVRVAQLSQEMKAIREGLSLQQTLLNEILTLLHPLAGGAVDDPTAPVTSPPPTRPGVTLPPSPTAYYNAAFGYFFNNQFDFAIEALAEALKRFPDAPEAARAQLFIGEAYFQMGAHNREALDAFAAVIKNYKDPEVVPDAYYKQGLVNEQLGQKEAACKSYEDVRALFKDSSAAILATQALRRLGCIK
jgi:TolA-binding protein